MSVPAPLITLLFLRYPFRLGTASSFEARTSRRGKEPGRSYCSINAVLLNSLPETTLRPKKESAAFFPLRAECNPG